MQAEEYFSTSDFQQARESYKNAIHTAGLHKFVNDEALSCELAARFYCETGDFASSLEHFNLAHKRYCGWGCVAKAIYHYRPWRAIRITINKTIH
jgi:hypothetical protein